MEDEEQSVEKTVAREAKPPSGLRLAVLLGMVVVGFALVAGGVLLSIPTAIRVVLIVGGLVFAGLFGALAAGAQRAGVKGTADGLQVGAEMPHDEIVRTTWHKTGFPKQGKMPPKQGKMPPKADDPIRRPRNPRSGGGS